MKNLSLIPVFLSFVFSSFSQSPSWDWGRNVSASSNSPLKHRIRTHSDCFGNLFVVGHCDTGATKPAIISDSGAYILKYDYKGKLVWGKQLEAFPADIGSDGAGCIYIGGRYEPWHNYGNYYADTIAAKGALLSKLNPDGNLIWKKNFPGNSCGISALIVSKEGNVYITGGFTNSLSLQNIILTDTHRLFIAQLNSDGQVQWAKSASQMMPVGEKNFYSDGNSIAFDPSGNIYVGFITSCGMYCNDHRLFKLNAGGQVIARRTVGKLWDAIIGICADSNSIYTTQNYGVWTSGGSVILKRYKQDLSDSLWLTTIGMWQCKTLGMQTRPVTDNAGYVYTGGSVGYQCWHKSEDSVKVEDEWLYLNAWTDIIISKINVTNGKIEKSYAAGGKHYDEIFDITMDNLGNCYAGGTFNSNSKHALPDTLCIASDCLVSLYGREELFVARLKLSEKTYPDAVDLKEVSADKITVYPNPANGKIWCELRNCNGNCNASLKDIYGRSVYCNSLSPGKNLLDLKGLTGGIYTLEIHETAGVWRKKIVLE